MIVLKYICFIDDVDYKIKLNAIDQKINSHNDNYKRFIKYITEFIIYKFDFNLVNNNIKSYNFDDIKYNVAFYLKYVKEYNLINNTYYFYFDEICTYIIEKVFKGSDELIESDRLSEFISKMKKYENNMKNIIEPTSKPRNVIIPHSPQQNIIIDDNED